MQGLYGGIAFKDSLSQQQQPSQHPPLEISPASVETPVQPDPTTTKTTSDDPKGKSSTWSAALRFAPVIRKKASSSHAIPTAFKAAFSSAEEATSQGKGQRIVGASKPSLSAFANPSISSAPNLIASAVSTSSTTTTTTPAAPVRQGRTLKPPPMTLEEEEDVNGFRQTTKGKRAAFNKGRGGWKGKQREDPALAYTDVPYDPARPCDYSTYKAFLQAQRAQRRLEREAELRRAQSPGSSYASSDEDRSGTEEQPNKKARLFAPPSSYNAPFSSDVLADSIPIPPPSLVNAPRAETGDEAYARRLAMSSALSRPAPPPRPLEPPPPSFAPASSAFTFTPPSATTYSPGPTSYGYQSAPPAPPQNFYPPPSRGAPSFAAASSSLPATIPPPPPGFVPPPFTPASNASTNPVGSVTPPVVGGIDISEAAARARQIAERLGKLAAMQPPLEATATPAPESAPSAPEQYDDRPFAERMMSKFGWKAGQGLGADESGMTAPLTVTKSPAAPNSKKGGSKNSKKKSDDPPPPVAVGMGASVKGRGTIVDASKEKRVASRAAAIGEPSRIVLLTGLCAPEDVDDDLPGEVAEEANKFAIVERCFVYIVPGETRVDEAVRIFCVMSGLAGAYNVVRQFDMRHFAGNVVKARYYDEAQFNLGEYSI